MKKILTIFLICALTGCASLSKNAWKEQAKKEQQQAVAFCKDVPYAGMDEYPHLFKLAFAYSLKLLWAQEAKKCVDKINTDFEESKSYADWTSASKNTIGGYTRVGSLVRGTAFTIAFTGLKREEAVEYKDEIVILFADGLLYTQEETKEDNDMNTPEFIEHAQKLLKNNLTKELEFLQKAKVY
ncbi:hypothetical protein Dip510_001476 [Elusimicrobium posterum]|uniref:hypothetical protein n=1 Tax=Elusimicrobium posterum TaxID=3116653 RepID=UPI003C774B27